MILLDKLTLQNFDIFAPLSKPAFEQVYKRIRVCGVERRFEPGEIIAHPGVPAQYVHFILSGSIKANSYSDDGAEIHVTRFSGKNRMFFFITCFNGALIRSYYSAETSCHLLLLHKEDIRSMMDDIPEFRWAVINALCTAMNSRLEHLYNLNYKKAKHRICAYLISVCQNEYITLGSNTINITMTQEELASYLNITRPVLSKELHKLQNEGYINIVGRKKIFIPAVEKLNEVLSDA